MRAAWPGLLGRLVRVQRGPAPHLPRHHWSNNDAGAHPGEGGWLVVARGRTLTQSATTGRSATGGRSSSCFQLRNAAFSLSPTPAKSISFTDFGTDNPMIVGQSVASGKGAASCFNDAWTCWFAETPLVGAKLPADLGARIKVQSATPGGMTIWWTI